MIITGSDGLRKYTVEYRETFFNSSRENTQWKFTCECKGFRVHRRRCRHIDEAKKSFCGWRELKHEPKMYYHAESGEAKCPLCNRMAYPVSDLRNMFEALL